MATNPTTINPTARRVDALKAYAKAKAKADAAKAEAEAAKALLLKVCPDEGVLEAEGYRATLVLRDVLDFDVLAAETLLPAADFEAITVRKIAPARWRLLASSFPENVVSEIAISKPTPVVTLKEVK
jgi:hypothetical protein